MEEADTNSLDELSDDTFMTAGGDAETLSPVGVNF